MILAAVMPVPDTISKYAFAGLLRGYKTAVVKCISYDLEVPASAEIVLEGYIEIGETALEGPSGDHTGYYNEKKQFPVFTVTHVSQRHDALYHSTYTCRPPDEPSVIGEALNELFIPIWQKKFPEIQYAGHAKRIMMGVWSFLRQFRYIKFIIVCDNDINARNWKDVIWAMMTRMDPVRDMVLMENTPVDYINFASPVPGLGSKIGMDATNKWPEETKRKWGTPITIDETVRIHVDTIWDQLGIIQNSHTA